MLVQIHEVSFQKRERYYNLVEKYQVELCFMQNLDHFFCILSVPFVSGQNP